MEIRRYTDARSFLDRGEAWLLRREAEHNVLLGVAYQILHGNHPFEEPIYLATVEHDGKVVGCAFRTPPFKLGLTRFPLAAVPSMVQDVREIFADLPAVSGPNEQVTRFADIWTRKVGGRSSIGTRQGIHSLESVVYAAGDVPGELRRAERSDRALVLQWADGFVHDSGIDVVDAHGRAERLMRDGSLYLWEDSGPRSMAAAAANTPNGVRVGYVYTPPPFRSRGYATATVASLSQRLLDEGRRFCFLYTDLANPTSNAIYERIGYRKECEVIDLLLA